jgi:transcriptional regulator with XRE-family HTH domain
LELADRTGRRVIPRHPKPPSASETVRAAIRASGLPIRELARRTGVEVSALSRFMHEQVGISLTTFEKLAPELGLRVVREVQPDTVRPTVQKKPLKKLTAIADRAAGKGNT